MLSEYKTSCSSEIRSRAQRYISVAEFAREISLAKNLIKARGLETRGAMLGLD